MNTRKALRSIRAILSFAVVFSVMLVGAIVAACSADFDYQNGKWQRTDRHTADIRDDETTVPSASQPLPEAAGAQFYVAPDGQANGDGSKERPWNLATALSHPGVVQPGDNIWLRGGTYRGAFTSKLRGRENQPVIIRQSPNERASIDGSLIVNGAWAIYWGFEVTNSNTDRSRVRPTGVEVNGPNTKLINLIVHDCGNGFAFWIPAVGAEMYGNIIYHNGWQTSSTAQGSGHAIYTQNDQGTKLLRENVIFSQFGFGIHAYTESGQINNYLFEGNVSFNNGSLTRQDDRYDNILVGGLQPAEHITLRENYTYHTLSKSNTKPNVRLHYAAQNNRDLRVEGNHFAGGSTVLSIEDWQQVVLTGNVIYGREQSLELQTPQSSLSTYQWDNNIFYQSVDSPAFNFQNKTLDFVEWQRTTGFDRNSKWVRGRSGWPTWPKIIVRRNEYEPGRSHIIVYNWGQQSAVDVDVSGVLRVGASYEVRNTQDYFGAPVATGNYDGRLLRLPMRNLKIARPIGGTSVPEFADEEFNVFVLIQTS